MVSLQALMSIPNGRIWKYCDDMAQVLNEVHTGMDLCRVWDLFPLKHDAVINTPRYTIRLGEELMVYPLVGEPNVVVPKTPKLQNEVPLDPSVLSPDEVQLVKAYLFGVVMTIQGVFGAL